MSLKRRCAIACLLAAGVVGGLAPGAQAALSDIPTPAVAGPLPVTGTPPSYPAGDRNHPFLATDIDLSKYGYVEREYTITGKAATYTGTTGTTDATRVATGGPAGDGLYPYKTRIVVRRPATDAAFNGTTVLEWDNVTALFDAEWNWFNDPDYMMRHGYAWVGVSAQRAGVTALKAWNPTRYGDLDVTSTGATNDPMSYDVFGATAKAVRGAADGRDPMGGLRTDRVIASGESQSGSRLNTYYNAIQPLHKAIDAFLITVATGALRTDTPQTKVMRVLSERENLNQTTTDPDTPSYRRWSVAGASHLPFKAYLSFAGPSGRDNGASAADCTKPALSRVPWPYVYNRALDALVRWQRDGTAPANGVPLSYTSPTALARDANGIALGGIRLPEVEVPTATNTGVNAAVAGSTSAFSAFCPLLGSWEQFDADKLAGLYTDYGDYVDRATAKAQAVADQGFVEQEDVSRLRRDAAAYTRLRPTAPTLGTTGTGGAVTLGFRGPDPQATSTAYEVQHRSGATGATFSTVPGQSAATTTAPAFTEGEGTWSYRVRGITQVAALAPFPAHEETTPYSAELGAVVVDRTAPPAPTVAADRAPEDATGGWFKDTVTLTSTGADDPVLADGTAPSGLDPASVPVARTRTTSGTLTAGGSTRDRAGNLSPQTLKGVQVDADAPVVEAGCPVGVFVGDAATAAVTASDGESGLAVDPTGSPAVDTSTAGIRTTTARAVDRVGHETTSTCTTTVRALPAAGAPGAAGAQGTPGVAGTPGAQGTPGAVGAVGAGGPAGPLGPAGAQGFPGLPGVNGAPGARGPAGRDAKVTCTVKRGASRTRVTCKVTRVVSGAEARITLRRGGRVVAAGTARRSGVVALRGTRRIAAGRYTLTVRVAGGKAVTRQVRLG